jgi:uncharacterized membrane protein
MEMFKLYRPVVIAFIALFVAVAVQAKDPIPLVDASVEPQVVNNSLGVAPAQYGNTAVTPPSSIFANVATINFDAGGVPNGGVGNGNGNGNQNHYPINNGLVFLLLGGLLIGIKALSDRAKKEIPDEV